MTTKTMTTLPTSTNEVSAYVEKLAAWLKGEMAYAICKAESIDNDAGWEARKTRLMATASGTTNIMVPSVRATAMGMSAIMTGEGESILFLYPT